MSWATLRLPIGNHSLTALPDGRLEVGWRRPILGPSALAERFVLPTAPRELWEALRFAVAGAGNALFTAGLISMLARIIDPRVAYVIAYALALFTAAWLVSRFVFRARLTGVRALRFGVLYVSVFLVGLLALQIALSLGMSRNLSGGVILVTAPLSFLGSRLIFPSNETRSPAPPG